MTVPDAGRAVIHKSHFVASAGTPLGHWNHLKTIPPATPEVSAELREHREGKVFFSVVRAIGGIAMTILLAYLTFFVVPGS